MTMRRREFSQAALLSCATVALTTLSTQAVAQAEADITHIAMGEEAPALEEVEMNLLIAVRDRLHLADVLRDAVKDTTPEWQEPHTGVPAGQGQGAPAIAAPTKLEEVV